MSLTLALPEAMGHSAHTPPPAADLSFGAQLQSQGGGLICLLDQVFAVVQPASPCLIEAWHPRLVATVGC